MTPMRLLKTTLTPASGTDAVQTVASTGTPTGGTFRLRFGDQITEDIAYNVSAADFELALEALSNIGGGGVAVTGSTLAGGYTVTFAAHMAGRNVDVFSLADNSLTGGTSPTVTVTNTTAGVDATFLGQSFPNDVIYSSATNLFYVNGATVGSSAPTWAGAAAASAVANPSSALQTTGFLLPKLTTTARDALTPVKGMMIYNTTSDDVEVYTGSAWTVVGTQS